MKNRAFRNSLTVMAAVIACLVGSEAKAQFGQAILSGTASDNVGSVGGRAPGRMVRSATSRAQSAISQSRVPVQISEPAQEDTIRPNAISQSLEGFLTQFNSVLSELLNLLIARAGGSPQSSFSLTSVPASPTTPTTPATPTSTSTTTVTTGPSGRR